jgi:hypothetical protein
MNNTFSIAGLLLPVGLIIGCATAPRVSIMESLDSAKCDAGEFRGLGVGTNDEAALSAAHSSLAKQIYSSVKVSEKYTQSQIVSDGNEQLIAGYTSQTLIEAMLSNAHDARVLRTKRDANEVGTVICMSQANAAKGFSERQRLVADSLELASEILQKTRHPGQKNAAWRNTQTFWNEFVRLQNLLNGFGVPKTGLFGSVNEIHAKAKDEYVAYCQNAKLHWEPEMENSYSEITFSMLSKNLKMEKSRCSGDGISLAYKNEEPECSYKFGLYNCSGKISLSVASCDGTGYLLLENSVEGTHQKQDYALEKMQGRLRTADFWKKWENEIKEWVPQCVD